MKISATIITLNEERSLPRAIETLRCCDEVLVVDSGSTDRTCALAEKFGARVIEAGWRGYAAQKNYAAECAQHDWVLSIDADEALSEGLEAEIWELRRHEPACDGYTAPRLTQYLGRWIRHGGWYPDRKVRLYDRRRGRWTGDYVHESVRMEGTVGHLRENLLHYTCDSLEQHLQSLDRYTTLAAQELVARGKTAGVGRLVLDPAWSFLRGYVVQRGFRDGAEGLTIAVLAAFYTFLKYAKARRLRQV